MLFIDLNKKRYIIGEVYALFKHEPRAATYLHFETHTQRLHHLYPNSTVEFQGHKLVGCYVGFPITQFEETSRETDLVPLGTMLYHYQRLDIAPGAMPVEKWVGTALEATSRKAACGVFRDDNGELFYIEITPKKVVVEKLEETCVIIDRKVVTVQALYEQRLKRLEAQVEEAKAYYQQFEEAGFDRPEAFMRSGLVRQF